MSIKFFSMLLQVNRRLPSLDELNGIFTGSTDYYDDGETHYRFEKEILKGRYFWMQARYGNTKPHSDTLMNTTNQIEEPNTRSENQVEMNNQFFLLYDSNPSNPTLYLYNTNKKGLIKRYLTNKMNKDVVIRSINIDPEDFFNKMKTIEEVVWVTKKNLLNLNPEVSDLFEDRQYRIELDGIDLPSNFQIQIKFRKSIISNLANMRKINILKRDIDAHEMVCVGRDDNHIEEILKHENYIQKIDINIDKDEKGFYDSVSVREELIRRIEVSDE